MAVTTQLDSETEEEKVTITRSTRENGMDVDEAIMHVLDKHKADMVVTNAEAADGQLSLEE